jgi:DNA-binding response OmpR family regulator
VRQTPTSALEIARSKRVNLAVIDMELPDMNGIQLTGELRALSDDTYIVVATVHDERSLTDAVLIKGANVFLVKPHGFMELYKRLTTAEIATLRKEPFTTIDQYGARLYRPVALNK